MSKASNITAETAPRLRVCYVWQGEVMADEVIPAGREVVIGSGKGVTITVAASLGLPDKFTVLRPGLQGYLLTLSKSMAGRLLLESGESDISATSERAGGEALTGDFQARPIGPRDAGLIELDAEGSHVLTFQFIEPELALPPSTWHDAALVLPALAFALILHIVIVAMTFVLHEPGSSLMFPGRTDLMTSYLVERPDPPPPPDKGAEEAASEDGEQKDVKSATAGKQGKAGGEGKKPRQRDPDPSEVAPEIETGLLSKESREVLRRATSRNPALDNRLKRGLARLKGMKRAGGVGSGSGTGIGFGPGRGGTGTTRGGKGGGPGGGGSVQGDFISQGKVDVGATRKPRGTGGSGRGRKEVAVVKTGGASGDFGGLTRAEIDRVVKSRSGLIRACYQRELNRARGLSGKLVVNFRISASGKVRSARVVSGKSTLRNAKVESCVKRQITRLEFPPKGGGVVNYPFIFSQG